MSSSYLRKKDKMGWDDRGGMGEKLEELRVDAQVSQGSASCNRKGFLVGYPLQRSRPASCNRKEFLVGY